MTEGDLTKEMLSGRVKFYRGITYALIALLFICVIGLIGTIYLNTKTEPEVLTLLITFITGLTTSLVAIITQGMQAARRLRSDDELQLGAEQIRLDVLEARDKAKKVEEATVKFPAPKEEMRE